MKRVAIVISSHNGHTRKIAEYMASQLRCSGRMVDIYNVVDTHGPSTTGLKGYDAVLLGGPLYFGEYSEQLLDWVASHSDRLNAMSCGFFSVGTSPAGQGDRARTDIDKAVRRFFKQTGLKPNYVAGFGGALPYTKFGPIKRFALKKMGARYGAPVDTTRDYELTDWTTVSMFTSAFVERDAQSSFAVVRRSGQSAMPSGWWGLSQAA